MVSPHATFLNHSLPQLRATRRINPALLTASVLQRRVPAISGLVRAWRVQLPYACHQRKKRLFHFLSNSGFDTVAVRSTRGGFGPHLPSGPVASADPDHD